MHPKGIGDRNTGTPLNLNLHVLRCPRKNTTKNLNVVLLPLLQGLYYGKLLEDAEKQGRICNVPYDAACLVNTYWDLGVGDTTAIWFIQQVGRAFHAIDYYEASGSGLDHYAKVLRQKPYAYEEHILPHDAAARDLSTGRARTPELFTKLGSKSKGFG